MADSIMRIADKMKVLIDENGPNYLKDDPYEFFKELIQSGVSDRKTASAILCFLANEMLDEVSSDSDFTELSKQIQKTCGFNKKTANRISAIFIQLYSQDNEEEWEKRDLEGLNSFREEEFIYSWDGAAYWDDGSGGVYCHYEAEITLMPTENTKIDRTLARELKKNPFMTKEAVGEHYRKQLKKYLDDEFDNYCNCDDYYQPCVEDFMVDRDVVRTWCKENGFEFVACEGEGYDDGYEPKLWNSGW